jgi:hypothetical protein
MNQPPEDGSNPRPRRSPPTVPNGSSNPCPPSPRPSGSRADTSAPPTSPLPGPRRGGTARPPPPSQTRPAAKGRRRAAPPTTDAAHLSLTKLHWADELQASSLHAWEGRGDYQETDYNRAALCSPVPTQPATCERPPTAWLLLLLHSPLWCQRRHAAHDVRAAGDDVVIPCHDLADPYGFLRSWNDSGIGACSATGPTSSA